MEFEINGYIKDKKLKNKVNKESQKRFQKYRILVFFIALLVSSFFRIFDDSIMASITVFVLTYVIILAIFEFKVYRELKNKKKK